MVILDQTLGMRRSWGQKLHRNHHFAIDGQVAAGYEIGSVQGAGSVGVEA